MIHGIKANMKNKLLIMKEKLLLKKRNLVESVFNVLNNAFVRSLEASLRSLTMTMPSPSKVTKSFEIEHTRHRSAANVLVHILSTLVAYSFKQTKPSMKMV